MLDEPPLLLMLGLALISFVLAAITWKLIERPFRRTVDGLFVISQMTLFAFIGFFTVSIIAFGFIGHKKDGFPERFNIAPELVKSFQRGLDAYECFDLPTPHVSEKWGCNIGSDEPNKPIDFMVFGDSHLLVTYGAFKQAAKNVNLKGYYAGIRQCTPFLGVHALRSDQQERNCNQLNQRVWEYARDQKIPLVILVSRWSYYTVGGYNGDQFSYIGMAANSVKSQENSIKAFEHGLLKTAEAYTSIGTKVVLLHQVPQQKFIPEEMYYKAYDTASILDALKSMSVSVDEHLSMQKYVFDLFQEASDKYPNVMSADMTHVFCKEVCLVGTEAESFYHDADHLSVSGGLQIVEQLEAIISSK